MKSQTTKSQNQLRRKNRGQSGTDQKIRVIIADDNPLCRKGLRDHLHEDGRFEVIAATDHAQAATGSTLKHEPDVVVLDSSALGMKSLELASLIRARNSRSQLVVFVPERDDKFLNQAISLGVKGYVLKRNSPEEITDCIATVASGAAYATPVLTDLLLQRRGKFEALSRRQPGLGHLTTAERRILQRISQGRTSREIAVECDISPRTVDSHRARICDKLGLSGSNRLLQFAVEHRDALSHLD